MSDRYTDRISDYLDGALGQGARRQVEHHLASCAECASLLADLERVVARARAMAEADAAPDEDLWPGIEARLRRAAETPLADLGRISHLTSPRRAASRRISFTIPQLAAACLALAVVSGTGAWILARDRDRPAPAAMALDAPAAATLAGSEDAIRDVAKLKEVLASRRNELDPATVRSLEESLLAIDTAIRQGQLALEADPKNPYLRDHLDGTMRRKVDLMRRATMLASAN
jgi:anti-sigma factor RsiW